MNAPDSVEKVGYLQHDIVRRLKPSEPGRQELFRKTLEEELEDDLEEKRKKRPQDEVVLEHKDEESGESGLPEDSEHPVQQPDQIKAAEPGDGGDDDTAATPAAPEPSDVTHVDVKA